MTPIGAFVAALLPDGTVKAQDLSDPSTVSVIVAEFDTHEDGFTAYYHDPIDKWEVFSSAEFKEFYAVVGPGHGLYDCAERTVQHFKAELINDGTVVMGGRLARALSRELLREMDNDHLAKINDTVKEVKLDLTSTRIPARKLKARWTVEAQQDLKNSTWSSLPKSLLRY